MAFIRTKRIGGKDYAYVVENSWQKGSRQKVKGYIGRVYRFDNEQDIDFCSFLGINNAEDYIKNNENKKIVGDIIKWEFFKNKIDDKKFNVDFENAKIKSSEKNVCININDGFLGSYTLANILNFQKLPDESDEQLGLRLAKAFIDAGIKVPQEVFISLFEKIKGKEDLSGFKGFYY